MSAASCMNRGMQMLELSNKKLVKFSVQGKIKHPLGGDIRIAHDGSLQALPAIGGITYNVKTGDNVFAFEADHIEPGVSIQNALPGESNALNMFSCIGNSARVVSGDAAGSFGVVTGKHGGCEHVIIHFEQAVLKKLKIGDDILIEAYGQGMKLRDFPSVIVQNIDPDLLQSLGIQIERGVIRVPVAGIIPSLLMGSGYGASHSFSGDYDMMTKDRALLEKLGLMSLRLGDLVLIEDSDNTVGRGYYPGARTLGVVIHGDCFAHGHGPGITSILTSKEPIIEGIIKGEANIADFIFKKCEALKEESENY